MTKADLIKQHLRLLKRYSNAFRKPLTTALKTQLRSLTDAQLNGETAVGVDAEMAAVIQKLYVAAGTGKASLTLRQLNRLPKTQKDGMMGFSAQWTADVINYFRLNLFNKVVLPISETTREYIRRIILEGTEKGWSLDYMRQQIERVDYLNGRIERILRTETNRALNLGGQLGAESYDFQTQKQWLSVHDERTRHPHMLADGQTVSIDQPFNVGGEALDFPGDPNGSGENTINCRCTSAIVPVRDGQGRLIPKETSRVRVRGRLRRDVQQIITDLTN